MQTITKFNASEYLCFLYKYKLGYGFKIFYQKKTKGNLVSESYCYYGKKEDCINAMRKRLTELKYITQDLFDFSKL